MAPLIPDPPFDIFDYRSHIIENCEFFGGRDQDISIITNKLPSGEVKATAVRWKDDTREAILTSDPCESYHKALVSLHNKSAEAVNLYQQSNGYSLPRNSKTDDLSDTDSILSGASSDESINMSGWGDSSDDDVVTPMISTKATSKNRKSRKAQPRHSRKSKLDDSDDEPSVVTLSPAKVVGFRYPHPPALPRGRLPVGPPPPPPSFRGPPSLLHQPPQQQQQPPPPPPGLRGPQPHLFYGHIPPHGTRPLSSGPPGPLSIRPFDVRLTIRWLNHGEQRILQQLQPSMLALQDAALDFVRANMDIFADVTSLDRSSALNLRALVKQAFLGTEAYSMSTYSGSDLTRLFRIAGLNDILRFEVEVDHVRPPGAASAPAPAPAPSLLPAPVPASGPSASLAMNAVEVVI